MQAAHKHFFNTPERSLKQAYQAALRIKSIEDEYFNRNKVITESARHGVYLTSRLTVGKLYLKAYQVTWALLQIEA